MQQLPPGFQLDQQPAPTRAPGIIRGAPSQAERRAEEDQALERARFANQQAVEAERLRLAREAEQRQATEAQRKAEQQASGFDATEGERKAAAFLLRALGANKSYEDTGVGPRSLVGQAARDTFPNATNYFTSADRQVAESAQDEFIAASLRQDSGAAIPEEELERQRRIYFPMPGDGPDVLEQKRQARLRAIAGLEQSAGRLLENTMSEWEQMQSAVAVQDNRDDQPDDGVLRGRVTDDSPPRPGEPGYRDPLASETFGEAGRIANAIGALGARGITLGLSDEAAGLGEGLGSVLTGGSFSEGFQRGQAGELARIEAARNAMGGASLPLEIAGAGGGLRAASGFSQAIRAARGVQASGNPVTRQAVQNALARRATVEGAGIGAVAGAAEGNTLQERGTNALLGGVAGGAVGRAGQAIGNRIANRAAPQGAAVQQAADRQGIEVIPAVTGGTTTQRLTAGARQGFISDRPIAAAVDRMEAQAQATRARASEAAGNATNAEDAGELVRRGAQVYSQRTSQIGGNLYDRADRMARGARVPLPRAVQALDEEIAQLEQSPTAEGSALLRDLRTLRGQIAEGEFSIPGIRAMRTDLREQVVARGLRYSPSDRIYTRVLQEAEEDAIAGLRERGLDNAAGAMQTARNFWRQRVETIDEVLDPLIGRNAPRSGEQILASLERMARPDSGNANNLRRLMQAMPKGEANAVRATVINRLGRPTAGAGDVDREGFSFATFLTNWNNMSPRARATMFPQESRAALDDLAAVAAAVKQAGAATNTSNTAGALAVQGLVTSGLWFLEPMTAFAGAGSQYAIGRLLASPRFARTLARAPRQDTTQARRGLTVQLGNLAKAEPTLAREIGIYQRALAANDNNLVGGVAAERENQAPR